MKTTYLIGIIQVLLVAVLFSSCDLETNPYDSKSEDLALATPEGLQIATYGAYGLLVEPNFVKMQHQLGEFGGDNVALSGNTGDPLRNIYNYNHLPNLAVTTNFWNQAYKVIFSANQIIERIGEEESTTLDQLKGENLFLRAMSHFELVKFFGRPYSQGNGENPGVIIQRSAVSEDLPSRSTVKEVYEFVISDLEKAASLMTIEKSGCFATKEAAFALLSRVYLYKEDYEKAIEYATMVISSGRYELLPTNQYKEYFTVAPENNRETIFAICHTLADNRNKGSLGSMYYSDATGTSGWGQMYASLDYVRLLNQHPEDARHSFIELQMANGDTIKRNNVPKIFVNKYSWQEGHVNLSSPVYLRLAEMYLNRAEANAKLGNLELAIEDVNIIRRRANLSGEALYSVGDLNEHESVLDVVLEERRMELAFEGHRPRDLFRNNLPLVREYIGFHSADLYHQTVLPTDSRVVPYIPEREIGLNPNLEQNP